MEAFTEREHLLVELWTRVFNDVEPPGGKTDAIFLVSQTPDNQDSVIEKGLALWSKGKSNFIALLDCRLGHGYPGFAVWQKELLNREWQVRQRLVRIKLSYDIPANTYTEAQALVAHAKEVGWKTLYLVAHPLHQDRAFRTVVKVLLRDYPTLCVYNQVGKSQSWHQVVRHSQGVLETKRRQLIHTELDRAFIYEEKGDIASPEQAFAYLDERDLVLNP